jgi:hypothetical protein
VTEELNLPPSVCHCGARLGGGASCHCTVCHGSFGTVAAFDRHRQHGQCLAPASVGLEELTQAGWTRWMVPRPQ